MKNNSDNICKFVPCKERGEIITTNFVYEKNPKDSHEKKTSNTNAVYLVTGGRGKLYGEFFEKELFSGTLFFTFSMSPFRIENTENLTYMYISFKGPRSEILFSKFGISAYSCVYEGFDFLISLWENFLVKANDENIDLISESTLLYTFSQLSLISDSPQNYLIGDILKFIEENFHNSDLSLSKTAEALNYSAKYISKIFKDKVGITFSEYLKNVRLQHATFLMENGITTVKNVALLSGFTDAFYFSNVFKKTFGVSPKKFLDKKK